MQFVRILKQLLGKSRLLYSAGWANSVAGEKLSVYVWLTVNQGGRNYHRSTQRSVILHAHWTDLLINSDQKAKKNKKLSYRRDSERSCWLRCTRSFKVIDVSTNRKPICDFLLWTILTCYRTVFQWSRSIGHLVAFDKGMPVVNALVLGNICEYRHKSYITEN